MNYGKVYISFILQTAMTLDKKPLKEIIGKLVVTKEGKRLGIVKDITFETRTGELIQIVIKDPTPYTRNLNLEVAPNKDILRPYNTIIAIGDFVVISEEDLS
jgi:sporulation protein YlmC with PRC-barrel domain